VRSIGCSVAEEDLFDLMVPRYITREVGLLDGSGAGLVRLLSVDLGIRAKTERTSSFDEVAARAGSQPILLGSQRWVGPSGNNVATVGHWVAVRRLENGELVLMNPAGTSGPNFGQQVVDRQGFDSRAPFTAVWIEAPPSPTPTPRPPTPARRF
jgi:hypothetical protein